jgi:hypothetical protein
LAVRVTVCAPRLKVKVSPMANALSMRTLTVCVAAGGRVSATTTAAGQCQCGRQ